MRLIQIEHVASVFHFNFELVLSIFRTEGWLLIPYLSASSQKNVITTKRQSVEGKVKHQVLTNSALIVDRMH